MKRKRVHPPHKLYVLRADGRRERINARKLIIELRDGIEIEVDLAPPSNFADHLVLFASPTAQMEELYDEGKVDSFEVLFGGANVLHVLVDRRLDRRKSARSGGPSANAPRKRSRSANKL